MKIRSPIVALWPILLGCVGQPRPFEEPSVIEKTIDYVAWSDDMAAWGELFDEPVILGHVVEREGAHEFTRRVDSSFSIEGEGYRGEARHGTGGVSNEHDFFIILRLGKRGLKEGRSYTLHPRNAVPGYRWRVPAQGLVLVR